MAGATIFSDAGLCAAVEPPFLEEVVPTGVDAAPTREALDRAIANSLAGVCGRAWCPSDSAHADEGGRELGRRRGAGPVRFGAFFDYRADGCTLPAGWLRGSPMRFRGELYWFDRWSPAHPLRCMREVGPIEDVGELGDRDNHHYGHHVGGPGVAHPKGAGKGRFEGTCLSCGASG